MFHLLSFHSSKDHTPVLSVVQYLNRVVSYIYLFCGVLAVSGRKASTVALIPSPLETCLL